MVCLCGIVCIGSLCKAARGNGHCRQHQHGQGAAQQPDGHSIHITVHHFQAPFPQAARRTPFRPGQHPFSWLRAPSIGPQRSQTRKKAQSEYTPGSIVCVKFMIALRAGFVKKNEELSLHSILAFISFVFPAQKSDSIFVFKSAVMFPGSTGKRLQTKTALPKQSRKMRYGVNQRLLN